MHTHIHTTHIPLVSLIAFIKVDVSSRAHFFLLFSFLFNHHSFTYMLRLSSPLQLQQVWERPKASPPPSSPIRYTDEQGM